MGWMAVGVALPASSWLLSAGGGGCCTFACIRRRWEPRNHAEQQRSVAGTVPLPCAQTPLTAHGSLIPAYDAYQKILSFQQKPAPAPQRPWSPMCNTDDKHTHQISPTTPRAEIGPIQLDQLDVEARTTSSRAKATCHAPRNRRRAADPRSTTDLDTSYDRSRGGIRPISVRRWTDLGEGVRGAGQGRPGPGPVGAGQWLSGASGLL